MRLLVFLLVVLLLAASATYAVLNLEERVDIHLPWVTLRGQPQIFLVLAALAAGALFTGVIALIDSTRLRLANRRIRRELDRLRRLGAAFPVEVAAPEPRRPAAPASGLSPALGPRPRSADPAERPVIPNAVRDVSEEDETPYGV